MHEEYVSKLAIIGAVLWGVSGSMLVAAWASYVVLGEDAFLPYLCGLTAIVFAAAALAAHTRRMTCRVLALIRATSGLDGGQGADLRAVR